jgi:CDP-6-deoxy-D-xylo-4-hexulose-3-dehydrase
MELAKNTMLHMDGKEETKQKIKELVCQYFHLKDEIFIPGKDFIQYAGAKFDHNEINSAIEVLLDGWFGLNQKGKEFESVFPSYLGKAKGVLVNSGSSANLIAISALKSDKFSEKLQDDDEIITCASSFPTTVNPIIMNKLTPVFVDAVMGNYNINVDMLEKAISPKTRAICFAHTLGNPVDMEIVTQIAEKYNLIVIEDCCDALGSSFDGKKIGSFGRMATSSFYPAHHITIGEGGFVSVNDDNDLMILQALRDWGRSCFCSGKNSQLKDGQCGKRFSKWLDGLDVIVDHKYVYSEIGYNLKPLELQAAIGIEQLNRLPDFENRRKKNFTTLYSFFAEYEEYFYLPEAHPLSDPCWFSFPLTVKNSAPFSRSEIVNYMEKRKIQTRNLFAGNLLRHPAYKNIKCRVVGDTNVSDMILTNTFFLGVYPGITQEMMDYIISSLKSFLCKY